MELFPFCYIAFALGSANCILLFTFKELSEILEGCLRTEDNPQIKKKEHYYFSFAIEGSKVYFKRKLPQNEYVEITEHLI